MILFRFAFMNLCCRGFLRWFFFGVVFFLNVYIKSMIFDVNWSKWGATNHPPAPPFQSKTIRKKSRDLNMFCVRCESDENRKLNCVRFVSLCPPHLDAATLFPPSNPHSFFNATNTNESSNKNHPIVYPPRTKK